MQSLKIKESGSSDILTFWRAKQTQWFVKMSSSEHSSSGESDDESLPDLQKLKPYDLEPEILSLDGISTSSDDEELSSSDCEAESRIGNTNWCQCEKCLSMSTYTENISCRDTNEVPDEYFEGNMIS